MNYVQFPLERVKWEGGWYLVPRVAVSLDGRTPAVSALIDTGAALSVIHPDFVALLGVSAADIESQGRAVVIDGVAGQVDGYLWAANFVLGADQQIRLPNVPCLVSPHVSDTLILGQQGVLERLYFEQRGPDLIGRLAEQFDED